MGDISTKKIIITQKESVALTDSFFHATIFLVLIS